MIMLSIPLHRIFRVTKFLPEDYLQTSSAHAHAMQITMACHPSRKMNVYSPPKKTTSVRTTNVLRMSHRMIGNKIFAPKGHTRSQTFEIAEKPGTYPIKMIEVVMPCFNEVTYCFLYHHRCRVIHLR